LESPFGSRSSTPILDTAPRHLCSPDPARHSAVTNAVPSTRTAQTRTHPSRETGTGSPRLQHCQAQFIPKSERPQIGLDSALSVAGPLFIPALDSARIQSIRRPLAKTLRENTGRRGGPDQVAFVQRWVQPRAQCRWRAARSSSALSSSARENGSRFRARSSACLYSSS
jgi:hypothetical protein